MYVDITKEPIVTCVEWFHGYGGNALGLKRVVPGLRSVAVCERDAFVVANMVSKMEKGLLDSVPIWTDCCTFPIQPFADRTDLFIASYPCQPFSHAGKRDGQNDDRHLWPSCRRFICGAHPDMVFLENVEGHVSLGLSTVLADLEEDGYTAAFGIFSASEVGAPHQRKRVFILAYDKSAERELGRDSRFGRSRLANGSGEELALGNSIGRSHGEPKEQSAEAGVDALGNAAASGGEDVADKLNEGLQGHAGDVYRTGREPGGADRSVAEESLCGNVWPSRPGERQYAWEPPRVVGLTKNSGERGQSGSGVEAGRETNAEREANNNNADRPSADSGQSEHGQTQPPMGGNADGPADGLDVPGLSGLGDTELAEIYSWMVDGTNRTDELRMCGNGVVPATAERAFRILFAEITRPAGLDTSILNEATKT